MDFDLSPKVLGIIFIVGGVSLVFVLLGGSLGQMFSSSIQENVVVTLKQGDTCVVEASDDVPRSISNCAYQKGENITITYKQGLPAIEKHQKG
ncbi:MAG: hypothetical protein M3162_07540 [Thermoproteota archaeon]|nr:hypothetical protein [Thermoproteota archaeon]